MEIRRSVHRLWRWIAEFSNQVPVERCRCRTNTVCVADYSCTFRKLEAGQFTGAKDYSEVIFTEQAWAIPIQVLYLWERYAFTVAGAVQSGNGYMYSPGAEGVQHVSRNCKWISTAIHWSIVLLYPWGCLVYGPLYMEVGSIYMGDCIMQVSSSCIHISWLLCILVQWDHP